MSEREATQRLLRARERFFALADKRPEGLPDEQRHAAAIVDALRELSAAEAALPPRYKRDSRRSKLESILEDLDLLVDGYLAMDGSVISPPPVFPAGIPDKLVSARRLLREALEAIRS